MWGGLNGVGLVVYKLWKRISPYEKSKHWAARSWKIMNTFLFITFTRIWFRSESMEKANQLIHQVTREFNFSIIPDVLWSYRLVFVVMALGYFTHWVPESWKLWLLNGFIRTPVWAKIINLWWLYLSFTSHGRPICSHLFTSSSDLLLFLSSS